jgi:hypothetical protein
MDWRKLLIPANAAESWTAAAAIATAVAVWFTWRAITYSARTLSFEQMPIVNLDRAGDGATLVNVGRGTGLNVLLTDDDGKFLASASAVRPDGRVAVSLSAVSADEGFDAYAQDSAGRWFYTRAVYNGLSWTDGLGFTNSFRGRIAAWRVPRKARRELRRQSESGWEYLQVISSYSNFRAWQFRAKNWWKWVRIDLPRLVERWPEARRLAQYGARDDAAAGRLVPPDERAAWDIDVDGIVPCWKGRRTVRQLSCAWEAGILICEVELRQEIRRLVRGLIRISRDAFDRLPTDRDSRHKQVRRKFSAYVCRLRPDQPFVFNLRTFGPFSINWP